MGMAGSVGAVSNTDGMPGRTFVKMESAVVQTSQSLAAFAIANVAAPRVNYTAASGRARLRNMDGRCGQKRCRKARDREREDRDGRRVGLDRVCGSRDRNVATLCRKPPLDLRAGGA